MMKKLLCLLIMISLCACKSTYLPYPQQDGSDFGIDENINMTTIDNYLNRNDVVYRDVRMLKDEANFEAIGGDSYLSGFINGFEVVPYPYICNVDDLPNEVGQTYTGTTLFTLKDGSFEPNFKESISIIESLFPRDKKIFLMCGGGGYASNMRTLLISLGYNASDIYNIGGYWTYEGNNSIDVKYEKDGETFYNLALVNYHVIDFDTLTLIGETSNIDTTFNLIDDLDGLNETIKNKKTFILYVYLPGCSTCASYTPIIKQLTMTYNLDMYALSLDSIWKTNNPITDLISVSPALFIFKDGKVLNYIDASSVYDYESSDDFYEWVIGNINIDLLTINCDACNIR